MKLLERAKKVIAIELDPRMVSTTRRSSVIGSDWLVAGLAQCLLLGALRP